MCGLFKFICNSKPSYKITGLLIWISVVSQLIARKITEL